MKARKLGGMILIMFFMVLLCSQAYAYDPGIPDTVRFGEPRIDLTGPPYDGACVLPVLVFNDEELRIIQIPLRWEGPLWCDSGKFVGERALYFASSNVVFDNETRVVYAHAGTIFGDPLIPTGDDELLYLYFSVLDTGFASIDTFSAYGWMYLHFIDGPMFEIIPQFVSTEFNILPPLPGDINGDGVIDLGDILSLISYLYKGGYPPEPLYRGDVNGDCVIDLGDVLYLISYLYKGGPVPLDGRAFL